MATPVMFVHRLKSVPLEFSTYLKHIDTMSSPERQ